MRLITLLCLAASFLLLYQHTEKEIPKESIYQLKE